MQELSDLFPELNNVIDSLPNKIDRAMFHIMLKSIRVYAQETTYNSLKDLQEQINKYPDNEKRFKEKKDIALTVDQYKINYQKCLNELEQDISRLQEDLNKIK